MNWTWPQEIRLPFKINKSLVQMMLPSTSGTDLMMSLSLRTSLSSLRSLSATYNRNLLSECLNFDWSKRLDYGMRLRRLYDMLSCVQPPQPSKKKVRNHLVWQQYLPCGKQATGYSSMYELTHTCCLTKDEKSLGRNHAKRASCLLSAKEALGHKEIII